MLNYQRVIVIKIQGRLFQRNPYLEEGRKALEMESTTPKQKKLQYNTFGCSQENADQKVTKELPKKKNKT